METRTDVAVVGLGAMGSMTLWRLAERGVRAIGVDAFDPPHDRGSSHGESRVFRTAYSEGALFVPLLREALPLWRELEAAASRELLTMTGALMIGRADSDTVAGARASAEEHGLEHALLDSAAAAARFPQHVLGPEDAVLVEPAAGVLRPEACIAAALGRARQLGAEVRTGTRVLAVSPRPGGVEMQLGAGEMLRARHAVVAAGPWTARLAPGLRGALRCERQVLAWFEVDDLPAFSPAAFPVFIRELSGGRLRYGLPTVDGRTVKIAVHHEGLATDADSVDRRVTAADLAPIDEFVATCLRGVRPGAVRATVCLYTNTPDERFLCGPIPGAPGVTLVGGCSGHSFKFASVLGDVAADLALTGSTPRDVGAFALDRPELSVGAREAGWHDGRP